MTEATPGGNLDQFLHDLANKQEAQDRELAAQAERIAALEGDNPPEPIPPEPVPEGTMIYGYGHTNRSKLEADTGVKVCADRCFENGNFYSAWSQTDSSKLASRYMPIVSFKCSNWAEAGRGQGRWGEDLDSFAASVPRDIFFICNHEPDNDGRNPADFVAMTQAFAEILARYPKVHYGLNLMSSWLNSNKQPSSEAYIPPKDSTAVPLFLSWNGYENGGQKDPGDLFGKAIDLNAKYSMPFAICETASSINAERWVKVVTDWANDHDALFLSYWPSQTSEAGSHNYYPPASAFPTFADVALAYGGTPS